MRPHAWKFLSSERRRKPPTYCRAAAEPSSFGSHLGPSDNMPGRRNFASSLQSAEARERANAALAIFLGAFLLFALEPMIAKMILPWFGGSAGVWIACLLFFQVALLAGYFYAHLLTNHVAPAQQWRVHVGLLILSLLLLPIGPGAYWKPHETSEPLPAILALLCATIGVPFLLLASTGPLVQSWRSRRPYADSPLTEYRFYGIVRTIPDNARAILDLVIRLSYFRGLEWRAGVAIAQASGGTSRDPARSK